MNKTTNTALVFLLIAIILGSTAYLLSSHATVADNQLALSGQVIVTYTDGSTSVTPMLSSGSLLAFIDVSSGKTVNHTQVTLYGTPQFSGATVSTWSITGTSTIRLRYANNITICTLADNAPLTTPSWAGPISSGQTVVLASSTISASQLEGLYTGWQDGAQYSYGVSLTSLTMTLHAENGDTASREAVPVSLAWNFRYSASTGSLQFTSLSVNWSVNVT